MNSADFARNAVQQAQIARVNAILGLEPEALPVADVFCFQTRDSE